MSNCFDFLLVNDELMTCLVLQAMLKNVQNISKIELAANGKEALKRASSAPFDVILMDLNMPIMDGFESCKLIKKFYKDCNE